jgi:three-Cys-motif partner protein
MKKNGDDKIYCPIDGLLASEVGKWAKEKHKILESYVDISHQARRKFIKTNSSTNEFKGGATYIDLFCGPGRSKIRDTNDWIDGSAIVAWKESVKKGAAFTKVLIADLDKEKLEACKTRLEKLGANVIAFNGSALDALSAFQSEIGSYGLNLSFIDPYNLRSLDFKLIEALNQHRRVDILIHLSKMDLQRNLPKNLKDIESDFDSFVPGWRERFDLNHNYHHIRQQVVDFWIEKVKKLDIKMSDKAHWQLITGPKNIPLYWLMLIAKNDLAINFWKEINKSEQQGFDF